MARRSRIRSRIKKSHFYTFRCLRPKTLDDQGPHVINGPGYTRIVHCNQPQLHLATKLLRYRSNYVSTTRYNMLTFLPKCLYEQFHRVANFYFLVAAILSVFPLSPFNKWSMIAPLVFVVGLSMGKEALEDWRRFMQDVAVNSRKACVHKGSGEFGRRMWKKLRVGDVVRVDKDEFFPADLLLLSSSYEDGICYVETMNLDGETNLKVKRCLDATLALEKDESFQSFSGIIKCEDPNPNLYTFVGNFECDGQVYPLDPNQILLRDSKLRNTTYIYGVVVFTGHDTKVMQNSTKSPSKRSSIEKRMDYIIYTLFALLLFVSFISSLGFAVMTKVQMGNWWYLRPDRPESLTNPTNPLYAWVVHLITALLLYGYLIPISLYVSIELVKVLQASFINQDLQLYDSESGTPAQARTSNLNEELGQVDTILSDKTGTLTCNQMDFLKCSIAGTSYGVRASEVELAAAKQMAMDVEEQGDEITNVPMTKVRTQRYTKLASRTSSDFELETVITASDEKDRKPTIGIKGFSFEDNRLMDDNWVNEPNPDDILMFFRILAVCHTAIPEVDEDTGKCTYEAESPDEVAFLVASREFGFEFTKRTQTSVFIAERFSPPGQPVDREYKVLNLLDFTSKRKRMSAIIRDEEGQILLLCKGADSIIFERLSKKGKDYLGATTKHLNEYGEAGLRTLALGYRKLDDAEYSEWNSEFHKAKTSVGADRDELLEKVSDMMEKELILVGATAVEDKLQKGITRLAKEGTGKTTLAIGDGANDVGMIQEADIGVGISGVEGMQAVMASDFSIAQFRFLERLLVVHGHWCYKRIAQMICYFFYKNIAFGLTLFYFEAFTGFSGQSIFNDSYLLLFNVVLTSLPVISLGVFEQDVPSDVCLEFPALYQQGPKNLFFDWYRILGWMGNGVYASIVIFSLNLGIFHVQSFRSDGQTADMNAMGTAMFTCIIWAVNVQIALTMSHFTWIQHVMIWGSIGAWYIFLALYGMLPPKLSGNIFHMLIEVLAPAPIFWLTTLLVIAATTLPYLFHISYQRSVNPLDHHIIQEIKHFRIDLEDERMWKREKSKAREKTKIGFTARVDAKIRQLRVKLQRKHSVLSVLAHKASAFLNTGRHHYRRWLYELNILAREQLPVTFFSVAHILTQPIENKIMFVIGSYIMYDDDEAIGRDSDMDQTQRQQTVEMSSKLLYRL
ncbi:hypothetical protein DY000_02010570 [Brassica cretica]|uniref:Phospholipid-transporting ATPase n=1 Tax=Brassica cretica TaxID=69181 RepID=A0ABQ7CKU9_BRACR|nr:hypothetical protein DY000_02010570 [Brassica cretica]